MARWDDIRDGKNSIFLQKVDIKAINSANLYKWQNIFRYLTYGFLAIFIFVSFFVISNGVSNILGNLNIGGETSEGAMQSIWTNVAAILNTSLAFSFLMYATYTANRRIFSEHRRFESYILWFLVYIFFGSAVYVIPLIVPWLNESGLSQVQATTVQFNNNTQIEGDVAITILKFLSIHWVKYPLLLLFIIEFAHTIYSYKKLLEVDPGKRKYWKSKIVSTFLAIVYLGIFVLSTIGDTATFVRRVANFVLWFIPVGTITQAAITTSIIRIIFLLIVLVILLIPAVYTLIQKVTIHQTTSASASLGFAYTILYFFASTINFAIKFDQRAGFAENINTNNYIFLGISLSCSVLFTVFFFSNRRTRFSSLFTFITISFIVFMIANINLIFNSIYGWATAFSGINIFMSSVIILPLLLFALFAKRQLVRQGRANRWFYFMFNFTLGLFTSVLAILPFFASIDQAISTSDISASTIVGVIANFIFNTLNIWVLIYILLAVFASISFLIILIKLFVSIGLMKSKVYANNLNYIEKLKQDVLANENKNKKNRIKTNGKDKNKVLAKGQV
ncbi:hypothetical protein [Mycoplasmopsis agassizii]|uniref:Transmembrane protein n=1 Tax=Mycoplasmopsis agassizii TaxID=33922 RepID=A0ABX4H5F7_9BACT|nr:hypothetical protein [Mycoplasmopsis agassizii]PAF55125.1 hypothetical protein CJF60_00355 [Mycoplasmopsis agassizii]SMC16639.1 hypothetical protein SAMN02745179_00294 [Mycoplasmopsis agassizii]